MSNLCLKNLNFVINKLKSSSPPPPTASSSDCYFTSNPISLTPSSTADNDDDFSSSTSSATDDFAAVFTSRRFFFASPGRSNSILDSSDARRRSIQGDDLVSEGLKVPKISRDLYGDFRRSMQEMVEAREMENNVRSDWEFLRELLSCYLRLNPKSTHKFIVKAFADLVLSLLASSSPPPRTPTTLRKFVILR